MSILTNDPSSEISVAERVAQQLTHEARMTYQNLVRVFNHGAKLFWANSRATPVEIAAALGPNAKEIFELHGKIGALLSTINPEAIAEGGSVVGEFTYNDNGTVTITVPPEPANI